jgi:2,3-bisphosphoglycerate-dependent phosphoglycerate mutase
LKTRLLLVRHGRTDWNIAGRFQGQHNTPLNDLGYRQAAAVARRLAAERPAAIYTSDLARACDTANAIAAAIGDSLATEDAIAPATSTDPFAPFDATPSTAYDLPSTRVDPRLREMNFGEWEGLTYAEIQQRNPQALKKWEMDIAHYTPPGGEALEHFAGRVRAAYQDICASHPEATVIIASHGGALQLMVALALGLPAEKFWQVYLSNASVSELRVYPEGAILNLLNDAHHLEGLA